MRRIAIGILGIVNVAALIATSPPPTWNLTESIEIDEIALSADHPEVEIIVGLEVGDALLAEEYWFSGFLDLDGKNHGGPGTLEIWHDDQLLSTQTIRKGEEDRPRNVAFTIDIGLEPTPDEVHLTLRADGELDLQASGSFTVTVDGGEDAPEGDSSLRLELR